MLYIVRYILDILHNVFIYSCILSLSEKYVLVGTLNSGCTGLSLTAERYEKNASEQLSHYNHILMNLTASVCAE